MRTDRSTRRERLNRLFERNALATSSGGLTHLRIEDEHLSGNRLVIDGTSVLNFGYCSYMALGTDDRIKTGAIEAIERFGPTFSSSIAYTSVDLYTESASSS